MLDPRPFLGIALAATLLSCGDGSARYEINYAPGFSDGPRQLSIFGVYHDGRMSNEAWTEIGAALSPQLGKRLCEVAYDDKLRAADPDLFNDLDKTTQSEGITEDLLDKFVSAAQGESIAVISLHIKSGAGQGQRIDSADPTGIAAGRRNALPGGRSRAAAAPTVAPHYWVLGEIRLTATLFSVKRRVTEGKITMVYTGSNVQEAIKKFTEQLGASLPHSTCRGWTWQGHDNDQR